MKLDFILAAAAAGFLATYAHAMFALTADRVGLVKLDFGKGLSMLFFGESYGGNPPYLLGLAAVHLNGIIARLRRSHRTEAARSALCAGGDLRPDPPPFFPVPFQPFHHEAWNFHGEDEPARLANRRCRAPHLRRPVGLDLAGALGAVYWSSEF